MTENPHTRWLEASTLQKAIRRNLPDIATDMATRLYERQPHRLTRRLGIICLEDVGLANIGLAHDYLLWMHRTNAPTLKDVTGWVEKLCASPKSRLLTHVSLAAKWHDDYKTPRLEAEFSEPATVMERVRGEPDPMAALAMVMGVKRNLLLRHLHEHVGGRLYNILKVAGRFHLEGLDLALIPTCGTEAERMVQNDIPAPTMLHGFPAFAYDSHTLLGQRAIQRWAKANFPELAELPKEKRKGLIRSTLFNVESGLLSDEAVFAVSPLVRAKLLEAIKPASMTTEEYEALRQKFIERLPELDKVRAEVARGIA